jgi:hypothetical protein
MGVVKDLNKVARQIGARIVAAAPSLAQFDPRVADSVCQLIRKALA